MQGNINIHPPSPVLPVPAQLPPPRPYFTGRTRELRTLGRWSDGVLERETPAVVVINGAGGAGKTSLALEWLHGIRDAFPDGQLFADLRTHGQDRHAAPVDPAELLGRFLRALGVAAAEVPADPEEQAALFRSLTVGRRVLIMADDAASAAQVRPLLPGHGPALVVVTSRRRLSGLAVDGARFLQLGPLGQDDAVRLLEEMLGAARTAEDPRAAHSLADLCGRLPLALCISAARLMTHRHWPLARVVAELSDESRRLAALTSEEDTSVQAVFDVAYRALTSDLARSYRLLSVHPGADFDAPAAAAAVGSGLRRTRELLERLVDANLLEELPEERYRFHDLARLHARAMADRDGPENERSAALERLLEHYLTRAVAADRILIPGRWQLGRHYSQPATASFTDSGEALGWLEKELPNLADLVDAAHSRGFHVQAWELCEALWGLFVLRKHYSTWLRTHKTGVAAAVALGDPLAQAHMLEALASGYLNARDFAEAARCSEEALALERSIGHRRGEAAALERLGVARFAVGDDRAAEEAFTRALEIHQELGRDRGVALMRRRLGEVLAQQGSPQATAHLGEALAYFTAHEDEYNRARTLGTLARSLAAQGNLAEAGERAKEALRSAVRAGARHEQANVHEVLADIAARADDPDAVRRHLEQAADIYERLGAPQAEGVRRRLAGRPDPGAHS